MNEETLRVLEFDKLRGILAGLTASEPGCAALGSLGPLPSAEEVEASLAEISEMVSLLADRGAPPVGGSRDLQGILESLGAEGTWLEAGAFLAVLSSLEAAKDCRGHFGDADDTPLLSELARGLNDLRPLREQLRRSIGPRGEILDGASFELADLRRNIRTIRERIRRALEAMLSDERLAGVFQDRIVTERNDRYVVPVRADHRGAVKGFVHDESASGQTLFVEPTRVLERNNELRGLLREELREVERILRRLSDGVRRERSVLAANQEILTRLDVIAAAGRFSQQCDGVAPQLCATPLVEFREARHPLLLCRSDGTFDTEGATPIDLLLPEQKSTLVISGPNTGGKTVALKTLGLLLLMVRCGLHVPCAPESRVHLFGSVYADIGDEQSIEASLSTFSGHLTRIKRVLDEADEESLVLLDEIGTGTDPAEGGALALAILDTLRDRGIRTVVTTHLNLVKGYAHLSDEVENAAVAFDPETLEPSYRLHYGIPGASNAFTIARRIGFADEVLDLAAGYLDPAEHRELEVMEQLNKLRREVEDDLALARRDREEARLDREKRRRLLEEITEQKQGVLAKAIQQGQQLVRDAERRLSQLLDEARAGEVDTRRKARLRSELKEVRRNLQEELLQPVMARGRTPEEVAVGEVLKIAVLGTDGTVLRTAEGSAELEVRGKKLRLPLKDLQQYCPRRFAERKSKSPAVRSRVERERFEPRLMLVGKRADDALALLDRFLDDALLKGMREVEIVHGAGEGILRRAVRNALAQHRGVAAFHAADAAHGGDNVTIAEIRG